MLLEHSPLCNPTLRLCNFATVTCYTNLLLVDIVCSKSCVFAMESCHRKILMPAPLAFWDHRIYGMSGIVGHKCDQKDKRNHRASISRSVLAVGRYGKNSFARRAQLRLIDLSLTLEAGFAIIGHLDDDRRKCCCLACLPYPRAWVWPEKPSTLSLFNYLRLVSAPFELARLARESWSCEALRRAHYPRAAIAGFDNVFRPTVSRLRRVRTSEDQGIPLS